MNRVLVPWTLGALTVLCACAGAELRAPSSAAGVRSEASGAPLSAEAASSERNAPAPFSAEEIREATSVGRTYVWDVETYDLPPMRQQVVFRAVSATEATSSYGEVDESGAWIGTPGSSTSSWEDLVAHATYPAGSTEISELEWTVPAGTFDAWQYTVTQVTAGGGERVTRVWFAKSLPGAPIQHESWQDGSLRSRMVLRSHTPGE